ncbi:recombinase family protein [Paenibacillus lemnae]|uniref:Recombinase family protein n=1 Tax=Paenibacillus lemnae TaxID=1330551 RepID=A0A848MCI7_PAELE|nr:recombinase family protein [Paenibacillus lemnae]NMO97850.1 recombinase family protein [Paenibacillus lemnae]
MIIGYMRPYQEDSQCEDQQEMLKKFPCDEIIQEPHCSPKRRSELYQLMDNLQQGDHLVVTKLFAWADTTRHLVDLLEQLEQKHAILISLQEGIRTDSAAAYSFQKIVGSLAEFQSDSIRETTLQGLMHAKEKGNLPGRPRKPDENVRRAIEMYQSKQYSLADIKETTGISKSTLYRYLES